MQIAEVIMQIAEVEQSLCRKSRAVVFKKCIKCLLGQPGIDEQPMTGKMSEMLCVGALEGHVAVATND